MAAPVDVLVAEALAVASFVRSYWRATYDGNHMTQPGLERERRKKNREKR